MDDQKHIRILQNILAEQIDKTLNRIWYTLVLLLIPFLLLVINTLTITINLVNNPQELVIFLYFCLGTLVFWGLITIGQNFCGWITFKKLSNELNATNLNLMKINQTWTCFYFFNHWYQTLNQELAIVSKNPDFCYQQNRRSLKYQNWKFIFISLILALIVLGYFLSLGLFWQSFALDNWTMILGCCFLVLYFAGLWPWLIYRQFVLNVKYQHYLHQQIDAYQFVFQQRWLFLKFICEKLEVY